MGILFSMLQFYSMNINENNRGFTIIELLVVIAIIGILSAIILTSLNSARLKSKDARIRSGLSSVRTAADLYYYKNNNTYGTANSCNLTMFIDTFSGMNNIVSAITTDAGGSANIDCGSNSTAWAVAVRLTAVSSNPWLCIDSKGIFKNYSVLTGTGPMNPAKSSVGGTACL